MKDIVTYQQLQFFVPFKALPKSVLKKILPYLQCYSVLPGKMILQQGNQDGLEYFLLHGEVILIAEIPKHIPNTSINTLDRLSLPYLTVVSHSLQAQHPIAHLKPRQYSVISKTAVRYFTISEQRIKQLSTPTTVNTDHYQVEEINHDELQQSRIYFDIHNDIQDKTFKLPSLPEIALRIRKALHNDAGDFNEVARIISTDPAITAKLMTAVNSPLYRGTTNINNILMAITRLGTETIKQLVMSFALQELFHSKNAFLRKQMVNVWQHSVHVASISFVLARFTPGFNPERALLAGLLHDIGIAPIINYAENYPDIIHKPTELTKAIEELRANIGAMVLQQWHFDEDLVHVALHAEDWFYESKKPSYSDIVIIAQMHAYLGTPQAKNIPIITQIPAFKKLALGHLSPDMSLQILNDAKEDIKQTQQLLST